RSMAQQRACRTDGMSAAFERAPSYVESLSPCLCFLPDHADAVAVANGPSRSERIEQGHTLDTFVEINARFFRQVAAREFAGDFGSPQHAHRLDRICRFSIGRLIEKVFDDVD